jgi:hypothetical protein
MVAVELYFFRRNRLACWLPPKRESGASRIFCLCQDLEFKNICETSFDYWRNSTAASLPRKDLYGLFGA